MRDDVTLPMMLRQLERLAYAFGKPFALKVQPMGEEYAAAFRRSGIPGVALEKSVDEAIGSGKRFPSVSDLIERSRGYMPTTDGERQPHGDTDLCPHCGMRYFYAGSESGRGVVLPRLRCGCPQSDPAWYTAAAVAWTEPDPANHQGRIKPRDYPEHPRYRANHQTEAA